MSADFGSIYDGLVSQYGGLDALTTVHLAVLRRLATVLCSDDAFSAQAITSLTALLPDVPGKAEGSSEWDLSQLSEEDFGALLSIAARAGALRTPDGASVSVASLPQSSVTETLERATERLREMTDLRHRIWAVEAELDAARTLRAETEAENGRLRAALAEASGAQAPDCAPLSCTGRAV
jgi:hypothetical protein